MFQLQVGYHIEGGLVHFSSSNMDGPCGTVPNLRGVSGVVHGITLVDADGRGNLGWMVGVVVYQNIAVSYDRAFILMLDNFSKGASCWWFVGISTILWRF